MHYLQKMILDKLRYEQPLSYTAMMPEGIESSHFRYHLKMLVTDKLVEKASDSYILTTEGQRVVDYLSTNRTTVLRTPKVITYTLLTYNKKLLLFKKDKEPYRDLLGLIGGKVHFGEDIPSAAAREVKEKCGLDQVLPRLVGVADIKISDKDSVLSHVTAYVHTAELERLPDVADQRLQIVGENQLHDHALLPDLLPLLKLIGEHKERFVVQLRCEV